MNRRTQWLAVVLGLTVLAGGIVGWRVLDEDEKPNQVVMGTTDEVGSLDPAAGYNVGSWMIFNNVFQTLLSFPRGATEPKPEAAESCSFQDGDSKVYRCELKDGLKFSNGSSLTSKDVKHSFDRTLALREVDGSPAYLLAGIKKIETPDSRTVVFRLATPDATFPYKISSNAAPIVDHRTYPAKKLREDNKIVGSGPYVLDFFDKKSAELSVNPNYQGQAKVQNSGTTVKFYTGDQKALKEAVSAGTVDLAYRGIAAGDIAAMQEKAEAGDGGGIEVVSGASSEVMHMIFNLKHPVAGKPGVRKAIAYLIDRSELVNDVYQRTAEALYSAIPAGIAGHTTPYHDKYGESPQPEQAKAALLSEGITEKVPATFWVTPNRYGPGTVAAFKKIAEQLNKSGLFEADVKSIPLEEYEAGMKKGKFGFYVRGWLPDYPDPDIFIAPFFGAENIVSNGYESPRIIDDLLPQTLAASDRGLALGTYEEIQDTVADDLPVLPLWQGKQYTVTHEYMDGIEWSIDAATVPRFWELIKNDWE